MLLVAVTLLGLAAASDYLLQERMSNNLAGGAHAERSANAALGWGEAWLMGPAGKLAPADSVDDLPLWSSDGPDSEPFDLKKLLVTAGFSPKQAFAKLSAARRLASPETDEQKKWVIDFAETLRRS